MSQRLESDSWTVPEFIPSLATMESLWKISKLPLALLEVRAQ
jgi:hypothetical protein